MAEWDSPSTGFESRMVGSRQAGHDSRYPGGWFNNHLTPTSDYNSSRRPDVDDQQDRERFVVD